MDFWLMQVLSTVNVNGNDVAFDYTNTYFSLNEAIIEAKLQSMNDDVLEVSVHHWKLLEDGTQEHVDTDFNCGIDYYFQNKDHREFK